MSVINWFIPNFVKESFHIMKRHILWIIICTQQIPPTTSPSDTIIIYILPPSPHHNAKTYVGRIVSYILDNGMEYVNELINRYVYIPRGQLSASSEDYQEEKHHDSIDRVNIVEQNPQPFDDSEVSNITFENGWLGSDSNNSIRSMINLNKIHEDFKNLKVDMNKENNNLSAIEADQDKIYEGSGNSKDQEPRVYLMVDNQ